MEKHQYLVSRIESSKYTGYATQCSLFKIERFRFGFSIPLVAKFLGKIRF